MADNEGDIQEVFRAPGGEELPPEVLGELRSVARLHAYDPQDLFYKWEHYIIKMEFQEPKLDLETVREFKKDLQETLERETREKAQTRTSDRRAVHATPRATGNADDVFGMLDGMRTTTPRTATSSAKRKAAFQTPSDSKIVRSAGKSSPTDGRTTAVGSHTNGVTPVPFSERQNAGQIMETLNGHLQACEPPIAPPAEPRIKLKANTDLPKFSFKPLAMHLSEASEVLDDRIDEFATLVQKHHRLDDAVFGNAATKSTSEIIAVGRVASDTPEAKLNTASLVLEMSRRTGAGLRVPLRFGPDESFEFFPGQIVAVRGTNASGDYFQVAQILDTPLQPPAVSLPSTVDMINERIGLEDSDSTNASHALNVMISAGPYTADDNLNFEPLHALVDKAVESSADVLILIGPLLDTEHPLVALGDFELPDDGTLEPDRATLSDAFRILVAAPLRRLTQANPGIMILTVPSARDAVNKHVAWPQEAFQKKELGLPRQARCLPNPIVLSLNETVVAISAQDILYDLQKEEAKLGTVKETDTLARLSRHVINQAHFYPLFPPTNRANLPKPGIENGTATGTPVDTSYLKLGEWPDARPDVLVLPSALPPFAKVVESVLVINPGTLSKRRGPGTFAQVAIHPRKLTEAERAKPGTGVLNQLHDRARVDVVRI